LHVTPKILRRSRATTSSNVCNTCFCVIHRQLHNNAVGTGGQTRSPRVTVDTGDAFGEGERGVVTIPDGLRPAVQGGPSKIDTHHAGTLVLRDKKVLWLLGLQGCYNEQCSFVVHMTMPIPMLVMQGPLSTADRGGGFIQWQSANSLSIANYSYSGACGTMSNSEAR